MDFSSERIVNSILVVSFIFNKYPPPGPIVQLLSLLFWDMYPRPSPDRSHLAEDGFRIFHAFIWSDLVDPGTSFLDVPGRLQELPPKGLWELFSLHYGPSGNHEGIGLRFSLPILFWHIRCPGLPLDAFIL